MMNEDNDKTVVRTRRMPFRAAPESDTEHGVNVLPVGTHLGEFEILDLIGEGGFGIVYLAYDHSLERHVALKEYMPSGLATRTTKMAVTVRSQHNVSTFTAGLKSFVNEAKMLAQFDSPSLVKVHRFWEGNGTAYMVMPFYEGITLKQALKERRVTPTENWLRLLLADLFDAIETIHSAQCFHRDIAPDNILLLKDGRPLLLDFGAARRVIGDLTQCLTVILKPGFAPIEQYADIAGLRQGAWTDIYALAAVVYYVITGRAPPPAVARMVHDEMVPAREAGKGRYSTAFLNVLDKALAVKPEQRYRSVAELRRALDIMGTVPRTLPGTSSRWDTTEIATTRIAEAKPEVKPEVKPEAPATAQADSARPEPRRTDKLHVHAAVENRPRHDRPAWLVLGLLLSAGIAAGVYLGTRHPWNGLPASSVATSGSEPAFESSGSSGASEQEQEDSSIATAPTAPAAPAPQPSIKRPASPPPEDIAPIAPRTNELAAMKPGGTQSAPQERRPTREEELWRTASKSDKASAYERYLKEYPKGLYAAVARLRLENKLPKTANMAPSAAPQDAKPRPEPKSQSKAAPPSAEEELWKTAAAINEVPAYEAYLHQYPNGGYAPIARDRLASLKPAEPAVPTPPPVEEKAPEPEAAPPEPQAPAATSPTNKQASIKPREPSPPAVPKLEATPKAAPEPPPASARKTLRMADQTMTGDFSVDPKTGSVTGSVKIVWTNGNQFEGTLVRGRKEGKGKFIWSNGQRYNGDWARDMPNGKGSIAFANGNRYEGEIRDGVPHGQGVNRFKDGDVYSGVWVGGRMQGRGRYTWANGSYWEGEFKDDKQTENGKMVFADGSSGAPAGASLSATGEAQGTETAATDKEAAEK